MANRTFLWSKRATLSRRVNIPELGQAGPIYDNEQTNAWASNRDWLYFTSWRDTASVLSRVHTKQ